MPPRKTTQKPTDQIRVYRFTAARGAGDDSFLASNTVERQALYLAEREGWYADRTEAVTSAYDRIRKHAATVRDDRHAAADAECATIIAACKEAEKVALAVLD